jgi:diaminopimelate epimerase
VNFEKWQALGNDYIIVDDRVFPFPLSPARIRLICDPHFGVGSDGILVLSQPDEPEHVANLRIFNPDGSEAELSGNGAREAILYLRHRGWTDGDVFSVKTLAGPVRATITSDRTCTVDMGVASLESKDFPDGAGDGRGTIEAAGREWSFQHVQIGNPQCSIAMPSPEDLTALDLPAIGPEFERNELFPNRSNVSWYSVTGPGRIRARIFERGVGETAASGTGAIGAAVAYVQTGGYSPVTVVLDGGELEVEVGENLHINLTGWAVPVIRGELAGEFIEELRATE